MKVLVIGGNRFIGLRLCHALSSQSGVDLFIANRTGQAPHAPGATVYKVDRNNLRNSHLDRDWDAVVDFATYNDDQVRESISYFKNIRHYIFISTSFVYSEGPDLKESLFDPRSLDLSQPSAAHSFSYQEGKRRAEAAFSQQSEFPTLCVRFPFLLGPDDYTRRLEFHVQRVERGQPIFFPAPRALCSFLSSEDACNFLQWSLKQPKIHGPINVASPDALGLHELIQKIESRTGRKALLSQNPTAENTSPFGVERDHYLNTELARRLGFKPSSVHSWIDDLIDGLTSGASSRGQLH